MKIQKCRKKSHHFLTLWPWPLTYDLEKLIRSGHYHYQCVYQIWEQSIPWFLSYRVNTIAGGGRLRRKTITSPDPSDTGDIIITGTQTEYQSKVGPTKDTPYLALIGELWHVLCEYLWENWAPYNSTIRYFQQYLGIPALPHLPLDKMAAISQTTFSKAFSWMKSFVFWFECHWSLFLRVQLAINQHWFR